MHSFGKMLKALPHHGRNRSRSRERGKSPVQESTTIPTGPVESKMGETTASRPKWNLASAKTNPIIKIKPATTSNSIEGTWSIAISCSKVNYNDTVIITNPVSPELQEDIRWVIEDFSRLDVLNRDRALDTRIATRKACEQFIKDLKLDDIVERVTSDVRSMTSTIYIEIEDNLSRSGTLFKLPWELLEHHSLWPEGTKYDSDTAKRLSLEIVVCRRAVANKKPVSERRRKPNDGVYKFEVSFSVGTIRDQYPTYNILIVSSRDTNDDDDADSHFQIARPLHAALSGVDETIHVNVEICRPGSRQALQKYLENQRKGYWNVVHLDMPIGQGFFHFHSINSAYFDAVPDYEVAELLHKHEVNTVFMTCNEGRVGSTTQATALAATFVAEGIPAVISAPYRLPKIYLMLMSSGFYQSILALHRKGPTYAAHATRKAMQTQDIKHFGRYHIPVKNTLEGLGLIVYDNGKTDKLDIQQYCYPNTEKTPKRFGNVAYQDAWLFGRDLDMMRLENRLLSRPETSNIQWLAGKKSVGKSQFLSHLTYWWALSKFIQTSVYIDLGQCLDTFGGVLAQFASVIPTVGLGECYADKYVTEVKTAVGADIKKTKVYKDLVKLLRSHRIYSHFDNVALWRPISLEKTAANETTWLEQRKLFLEFVEEIRGGHSFVLLVCPWNDRSIRGDNDVFELKSLRIHDVSNQYGIEEWDKWVEHTSSISTKQTVAQKAQAREIVEFHDAVVESSQGLFAARQQFVYNMPFNTEQRTKDIWILLHGNLPSTAGPYNMDNSPSAWLVEQIYDLLIRDRDDLEDKNPYANANILRLMFSLSTFFGRIPKDIKYYLVLLWFYGLFTPEWDLGGKQYDHSGKDANYILDSDDFPEAYAAFDDSTLHWEWKRLIQTLIEYDYASDAGLEYWELNPTVTFAMRKIVYASDGALTTPILSLAIQSAAMDYHMNRYKTIQYGEPFDATCKLLLEKDTFVSQVLSAIMNSDSTPLKSLHLVVASPMAVLFVPRMNEHTFTAADKRIALHLAGCIANLFDSFVAPESFFTANPELFDSVHFYEFWRLAYMCAERIAIYHNGTSHLADQFDIAVHMMRRHKAFGQRYDAERRRQDAMDQFDESLQAAESIREELVQLGILRHEGAENDTEPPPAYEPAREQDAQETEQQT